MPKPKKNLWKVPPVLKECQVCYTELNPKSIILLPCGCETCSPCLVQWVLSKLKECNGYEDYPIPCLNILCKKKFKAKEIIHKLSRKNQTMISDVLLKGYISQQNDIAKCPNPKCKFAGVIDLKPCKKDLNCILCGASWRDLRQYSKMELIGRQIHKVVTQKNEILSFITKYKTTKECPNCKVSIQKSDGCEHMTCTRCHYEFCWNCFEKHPNHNQKIHRANKDKKAALRSIFSFVVISLLIVSLYGLYLIPPINFICSWTIIPVLVFFKNIILSMFSSIHETFPWIFWVLSNSALATCIIVPAWLLTYGKSSLQPKIFFTIVLLVSCFLTYYFERILSVLGTGLIELALLGLLRFVIYMRWRAQLKKMERARGLRSNID